MRSLILAALLLSACTKQEAANLKADAIDCAKQAVDSSLFSNVVLALGSADYAHSLEAIGESRGLGAVLCLVQHVIDDRTAPNALTMDESDAVLEHAKAFLLAHGVSMP
jgi:hypothetical protein